VPEVLEAAIAPTSLQQILVNLLQNARAAILSEGSSGRISISCSTWNDGHLRVEVADSGPGIDRGLRQRIFEPFERGQLGMPGTGLGLTVCRELLNAVKGSIHVEPNDGGGARFVIELPAATRTGELSRRTGPDSEHNPAPNAAHASERNSERDQVA
jgi:signal transduction histidine kinase